MNTEKFLSLIKKSPGCWKWVGPIKIDSGYGRFYIDGRYYPAHRVSYEHFKGPIRSGMHVMHLCDNPICVNPDHLKQGTHQDNMKDRDLKGRCYHSNRTHCSNGHPFSGDNLKIETYRYKGKVRTI